MQRDGERRDLAGQFVGPVAGPGVAGFADGAGDLGDQVRLPVGGGPEGPQVPRFDTVFAQRMGALCDDHGMFVEEARRAGDDHAALDQRGQQLRGDARALQQILPAEPDLRGRDVSGWRKPVYDALYEFGYVGQMQSMSDCLLKGWAPRQSGRDGLRVLEIIMQAYEAAQNRKGI